MNNKTENIYNCKLCGNPFEEKNFDVNLGVCKNCKHDLPHCNKCGIKSETVNVTKESMNHTKYSNLKYEIMSLVAGNHTGGAKRFYNEDSNENGFLYWLMEKRRAEIENNDERIKHCLDRLEKYEQNLNFY